MNMIKKGKHTVTKSQLRTSERYGITFFALTEMLTFT